jgi:hypothetical protein
MLLTKNLESIMRLALESPTWSDIDVVEAASL